MSYFANVNKKTKTVLIVIVSILALGMLSSALSDDEAMPTEESTTTTTASEQTTTTTTIEETDPEPEAPGIGDTATERNISVTVNSVETIYDRDDKYLIIHVSVENNGNSNQRVSPSHFEIRNNRGQIHDAGLKALIQADLDRVELAPGGEIDGSIAFEISEDVYSWTLQFKRGIFDSSPLIEIELGEIE